MNLPQAQLEIFRASLPAKPYCTDDPKAGLRIRKAEEAIRYKLIQPNHPDTIRWMVYDLDSPTARLDWQDWNAPEPNILVVNRENGHAHALYGLADPVHIRHGKSPARNHPLRYAAAVDVGLTKRLDADRGYSKLITKNPHHPHWEVLDLRGYLYDLAELADYVDMSDAIDSRRNLDSVGLGRNCTLFDRLRLWAYSERRKGEFLNFDMWDWMIKNRAEAYNDFPAPLPSSEVKCTARSISKWVWRYMSPAGFQRWGDNRRAKSIRVRVAQSEEKAVEARILRLEGKKQREIAEILGTSERHVRRFLSELKTGHL